MSYIDSPDARVWAVPHGAREVASNHVGGAFARDPFVSRFTPRIPEASPGSEPAASAAPDEDRTAA
jgi:hypothetical protein